MQLNNMHTQESIAVLELQHVYFGECEGILIVNNPVFLHPIFIASAALTLFTKKQAARSGANSSASGAMAFSASC